MPVTPDQGRMIASLAVASRPYGAPRWDEAGTIAAIKRISTWNLALVIDNVIKHASDPKAATPGVIGGSYTPPDLIQPSAVPPKKREACIRCGLRRPCACTREHLAADHDEQPATPPDRPRPADPETRKAAAERIRAELRAVSEESA